VDVVTDDWLTDSEQRAWRAYLGFHRQLTARLHRQLQDDSQLSLTDYEVLVLLSEAPDCRLRPFEMVRGLAWEQSRLSHHLTRMQRRGLISREECCADGRGAVIALTPAGRQAIEAASPGHARTVRSLFFEALTPEQVTDLERISDQALERIDDGEECPDSVEG
jgi:DNA-binding MarR family transcriptional regulator